MLAAGVSRAAFVVASRPTDHHHLTGLFALRICLLAITGVFWGWQSQALNLTEEAGSVIVETDDRLRELDDFSFDLVVRFQSFEDGNMLTLHDMWDQDGFYLQFYDQSLILGFGDSGSYQLVMTKPSPLEPDQWHHITAVKEGTVARVYVDGVELANDDVDADVVDSEGDLQIGTINYAPPMELQSLRFWDQPLTAVEVGVLASEEKTGDLPSPVIHYDLTSIDAGNVRNLAEDRYHAQFVSADQDEGTGSYVVPTGVPASEPKDAPAAAAPVDGQAADWPLVKLATLFVLIIVASAIVLFLKRWHPFGPDRRGGQGDGRTETLSGEDMQRVKEKIERAMAEQRLHENPNLTLRQLSEAAGVPEDRISTVLNRHMNTNFYEVVNGKRVEEAKTLLQQDLDRNVLDIALAVGFNSKSTFYAAFKKMTDQTPNEYRLSLDPPKDEGPLSKAGSKTG